MDELGLVLGSCRRLPSGDSYRAGTSSSSLPSPTLRSPIHRNQNLSASPSQDRNGYTGKLRSLDEKG